MAEKDERETRFQKFIDEPGSPGSRLRDAFAQLLAQGSGQAVPVEAVWQAQARNQWPPPHPLQGETLDRIGAVGDPNTFTRQRQFNPDPRLDFPTAPQGLNAPSPQQEILEQTEKLLGPKRKSFPDAKEYHQKPYNLPESPKKNEKKNEKKDKD